MARMFHEPESNVYVILIVGFKSSINPHSFKANLVDTIVKHPRFSSSRGWRNEWVKTKVDIDKHVKVPMVDQDMVSPDMFVEDYISNLSKTQISKSIPIWDCHNLNLKTSDAESTLVIRVHHSLGDGTSHVTPNLLLRCFAEFPGDEETDIQRHWMCCFYFSENRASNCLDDVKSVKNATNTTVNDVMLAITQAGLSTYLNRKYAKGDNGEAREGESNLPDSIRLTATLFINMRSSPGALEEMVKKNSKAEWGNKIGYVNFPLKIALKDNPLDYIKDAKATMGRKKATLEAKFRLFMAKLATFASATMWFSNVDGPQDQISIFGNQVAFIAPSLYGQTVVSYLLFKGKIAIYNS
ncbi:Detected protein of unknown function [Hibiscus syriacus]|uniref:O-acyltransferase WSD1 C-terminal domain-containing protein n=1 Tax=Hibiscus syriacus TaxID=106335 RepID=A0A6A3CWD9_HIBSY|nr:Detected protein of unknown function [Hibiscus syriacus]